MFAAAESNFYNTFLSSLQMNFINLSNDLINLYLKDSKLFIQAYLNMLGAVNLTNNTADTDFTVLMNHCLIVLKHWKMDKNLC